MQFKLPLFDYFTSPCSLRDSAPLTGRLLTVGKNYILPTDGSDPNQPFERLIFSIATVPQILKARPNLHHGTNMEPILHVANFSRKPLMVFRPK